MWEVDGSGGADNDWVWSREGLDGLVEQMQLCGTGQLQAVLEGGAAAENSKPLQSRSSVHGAKIHCVFSLSVVLKQDPCISAIPSPPSLYLPFQPLPT